MNENYQFSHTNIKLAKRKRRSKGRKNQSQKQFRLFILLVLLVFSGIGLFFYYNSNTKTAYNNFVGNLNIGLYTDALIELEEFSSVFKYKYRRHNSKKSDHLPTADDRHKFIIKLVKSLQEMETGNFTQAMVLLKQSSYKIKKVLTGSGGQKPAFENLMTTELTEIIDSWREYRKLELYLPYKIKRNINRMDQQSILAQDLSTEFGSIMGLAPANLNILKDRIQFYRKGMLRGLPVLRGLPDNIKTPVQLKQRLRKAGGYVNIRGKEDTPKLFKKTLSDIRKKCALFENQIVDLEKENERLKKKLELLNKKFQKQISTYQFRLKRMIEAYVRPKINEDL